MVTKKKSVKKITKKAATKKVASKKASKKLQVGEVAPAFTLLDQNGKRVSLKDFRGQNVVVYFYPKAMTPGCTVQACSLRDNRDELKEEKIVVLGISIDPVKRLKQFEEKEKLNFTLLSDENHEIAEAYGSWGLKKFMGREYMGILRQSFFIDKSGKIVHIMHKVDTKTHHTEILNSFKNQE